MARYNYVEPKIIISVVIGMMMLAIGAFAYYSVSRGLTDSAHLSLNGKECWNIGTPSNPETYNGLPSSTNEIIKVIEYYDDGTHAEIDSSDYTWSIDNPTFISITVTGG